MGHGKLIDVTSADLGYTHQSMGHIKFTSVTRIDSGCTNQNRLFADYYHGEGVLTRSIPMIFQKKSSSNSRKLSFKGFHEGAGMTFTLKQYCENSVPYCHLTLQSKENPRYYYPGERLEGDLNEVAMRLWPDNH